MPLNGATDIAKTADGGSRHDHRRRVRMINRGDGMAFYNTALGG